MKRPEDEVWEMTIGKIITLYREYKSTWDLEEKMRRNRAYYSDLEDVQIKKEHIVEF